MKKMLIGNVAVNSVVKFPRNSTLYKVLEHKDGYTYLRELLLYHEEMSILGVSDLVVVDWFTVKIVEGF